MAKFRKKPVVIEAIRWSGDNHSDVEVFAQRDLRVTTAPGDRLEDRILVIPTLEGDHQARVGDMIIRGVKGELCPCKPDIFDATYEPADEAPKGGVHVDLVPLQARSRLYEFRAEIAITPMLLELGGERLIRILAQEIGEALQRMNAPQRFEGKVR